MVVPMRSILVLVLLILVSLVLPASAVTITERPETIANGQPIFVTIRDLPANSSFSLLVQADCAVQPNSEFRFQMSQFVMPFALKKSSITATLSGTSTNRLEVMKESTIVTVSGKSRDGQFSTTKQYDITPGTYDYFRLSGTSLPTARSITAQLQVTGTTQGSKDSEISFVVEGLTSGTITIAALVDGRQALYKNIPIGGSDPSPAGSGLAAASIAAPPPEQWRTFTSADGMVSVTVSHAEPVGFLRVPAQDPGLGMRVLSGPYTLVPQDASFTPPGRIEFRIPAGVPSEGLVIASHDRETWTSLPSTIGNTTVTAPVTASGTFALLGPLPAPTLTTIPATPATTIPKTTRTPSPTPTPTTGAGVEPATLLLAAGAACAVAMRKRD
ncbi:MAG: hypothetical protein A4E39_01515 [Methanoregulaceae archaeon PtaB.Bin152]|nr:MAG: hypothetical protein A4E39_01515 [Methanoregulaceae archaeon PtaB.Bin152]